MAFTQKGSYAQAVQRGQVPQMVSVGTQVQLQDMVAAVRPSNKPTKQAPRASSQGGPEASTSVGGSQHNIEVKQTSVTVPRSLPPLRRPTASQSTNSDEHPGGADSMEVCPLDTEGMGDPAPVSRPPRQPVVPPQGGGKGGRNPVSAPKKST